MSKVRKLVRHPIKFWRDSPVGKKLFPRLERLDKGNHPVDEPDYGVMTASYDPKKNFMIIRGGVASKYGVTRVVCAEKSGLALAETSCNPPKKGYPESFPDFMQGADWFNIRRKGVFDNPRKAAQPLDIHCYNDAGDLVLTFKLHLHQQKIEIPRSARKGKDYHLTIDRFFFESYWGICSIAGGFYSKNGVQHVELWADETCIGKADFGMQRPMSKLTLNPKNGYALETRIGVDLRQAERIFVRAFDGEGKEFQHTMHPRFLEQSQDGRVLYYNKKKAQLIALKKRYKKNLKLRLRAYALRWAKQYYLSWMVTPALYMRASAPREKVMLFVNNINPGGRPEKWEYFLNLHAALKEQGAELIIMQMGNAVIPEGAPMKLLTLGTTRAPWWCSSWFMRRRMGKTRREMLTMLHEAAMLDYGYEANKFNRMMDWMDSFWRVGRRLRVVDKLLRKHKPTVALIWHEWNPDSHVTKWVCDGYGIPSLFCHDGALPLTMGMDPVGEMAESIPVAHAPDYLAQPISEGDLQKARDYCHMVTSTGMNRKTAVSEGSLGAVLNDLKAQGKKILFFAGTNDWQTGMLPLWWDKSLIHSPVFVDTYDTFIYLKKLCEERDWVMVFKPHPHLEPPRLDLSSEHVIFVREANIHECVRLADVTLTLVSATGYMSMMNSRPTILLGRNSLSESGCVYQATDIAGIPDLIESAIAQEGFAEMKEAWVDHVARLMRYTMHPMHQDSIEILGRGYDDTARFILKQSRFSPALHLFAKKR